MTARDAISIALGTSSGLPVWPLAAFATSWLLWQATAAGLRHYADTLDLYAGMSGDE
jgi:hypothetical protein